MVGRAVLAMFPFAHLDRAYAAFWESLRTQVKWLPERLETGGDPTESWLDPSLALGMTCGWPLVTVLRDRVRTLGSFHYTVDGAQDFRYRSAVVGPHPAGSPTPTGRAVISEPLSLSGHVSLLRYARVAHVAQVAGWQDQIVESGSHHKSAAMVAGGEADIASIDAVTYSHLQLADPGIMRKVVQIGAGPLVPTLPLICSVDVTESQVAELRQGIGRTVYDPANQEAMATLRISGFSPLELADYDRFII